MKAPTPTIHLQKFWHQLHQHGNTSYRILLAWLIGLFAILASLMNATPAYAQSSGVTCNGTIFRDDNGDGAMTSGEPRVPAARVEIYDGSTPPILLGQTITDGTGEWMMPDIPAGTPIVVQIKTPLPGGMIEGPKGPDSNGFTLFTTSNSCTDMTFGALLVSACSNLCEEVGDRVWFDENADGRQGANEPGIAGVTVSLYETDGTLVHQTTTDDNGYYLFTCVEGIEPLTEYNIIFDNDADYAEGGPLFETFLTSPYQGADPQLDSTGVISGSYATVNWTTGVPGSSAHNLDAGFTPPATIGDTVWNDVNGNQVQDSYDLGHSDVFSDFHSINFWPMMPITPVTNIAETGIPSVTVNLYTAGTDTVVGTSDDVLVDTTVTDALGQYRFRPLEPNIPYLVEVITTTLPGSMTATYDEDGAGDHKIVVSSPNIVAGEQYMTADFGYTGVVDLGITKEADFPDFRPRDEIVWTVVVTNYGSIPAPNVVVADVMGELWGRVPWSKTSDEIDGDATFDIILARIFELYWELEDSGRSYGYHTFATGGGIYDTREEVEGVIDDWIQNNVSVSGTDWTCKFDYNLVFPIGYPFQPEFLEDPPYIDFQWIYGDLEIAPQDIQLYYLCSLDSDLAPGETAPPITFSISNEFNQINHDLETIGLAGNNVISDWDTVPEMWALDNETNYAVTESFYGAEPFGTYDNLDDAVIEHVGDLQWEKALLNPGDAPFDLGEDMFWEITVTNSGSTPWYENIQMHDRLSNGYITETPAAPWVCNPLKEIASSNTSINCIYPKIIGGLVPGESITATVTGRYKTSGSLGYTPNTGTFYNQARPQNQTSSDDDRGNNSAQVPFTVASSAWTVSKGAGVIVDGEMEWTITHTASRASIPAGQVLVIEERLPSSSPFISVESTGWQCEARYENPWPGSSTRNYQYCWYDPALDASDPIPALVIRSEYADGLVNKACPGQAIRFGPFEWNFSRHVGGCDSSPAFNGVPGSPTDMTIVKTHDVATEPWIRGTNGVFTLTISELGVGADRPVVEDVLQNGLELFDVRNSAGVSLIDANGDDIPGGGWDCVSNAGGDTVPLRVFQTSSVDLDNDMFQCIREADLDNSSDTLIVEVTVTSDAPGLVQNDAAVEGLTKAEPKKTTNNAAYPWEIDDAGTVDNFTKDEVPVPSPDLQIVKSHVEPVFFNVPFDFTIVVTNNNDFSALSAPIDTVPVGGPLLLPVHITDTFPLGLEYVGFSGTDWTCASNGAAPPVISCSYGTSGNSLASGAAAPPLTITTLSPNPTLSQARNAVTVWSDQSPIIVYSGTPDVDYDSVNIDVPALNASKTSSTPQVVVGDTDTDTFDFVLAVNNGGDGAAPAPVRITDTMPTAFDINAITPTADWDCSASSNQLIDCTYVGGTSGAINMPAGATAVVSVNVTTADDAPEGKIINTMSVSFAGDQQLPGNLVSSNAINVSRYANLTIGKVRDIEEPEIGDTISYSVVITNAGPSGAQGVRVLDYLPVGTTYVDNLGSDSAWSCNSDGGSPELVTCTLAGDMAVGTAPALNLRMSVSAEALPAISNFITIQSNTGTTPDFSDVPYALDEYAAITGCLGDFVWHDANNDGVQDSNEFPLSNVELSIEYPDGSTVTTTTDMFGQYWFEFLLPDTYTVTVNSTTVPTDFLPTWDLDSGLIGPNHTAVAEVGGTSPLIRSDVDFGYDDLIPGSIGNYVWLDEDNDGFQDAGEHGIPNVVVSMVNGVGQVVTTTTDANGGYAFSDLPPGTYTVTIDASQSALAGAGLEYTVLNQNGGADFGNQNPTGYAMTIGVGGVDLSGDFGFNFNSDEEVNTNSGVAAIGDTIWIDSDGDGIEDPNEIGVSGVEVTLYGADGAVVSTTLTDANGHYLFDNLPAGAYSVEVTDSSAASHDVLADYTQTGDPDHFGTTGSNNDNYGDLVVLAPGDVFVNMDFGYQPDGAVLNTIGDTIWFDTNADGIEDNSENGIAGVTVALLDSAGNIIATDVTDANGNYLFTDLPDGTYSVWVNDTDGVLVGLSQSGDPDVSFDNMSTTSVADGQTDLDQDFGYTPQGNDPVKGLIGDTVWLDLDGNGTQDPNEGGIPDVEVHLELPSGEIVTTTTNAQGQYFFPGLPISTTAQTFTITVITSTLPDGVAQTADFDGLGTPNQSTTTLSVADPVDLDQDFGYNGLNSLGNLIWNDANADGVYDLNGADNILGTDDDEPLLSDVTLDIYMDSNGNGILDAGDAVVATTTTAGTSGAVAADDGNYLVEGLPDGNFFVVVSDDNGELNGYWHSLGTTGLTNNSQNDAYFSVDLDSAQGSATGVQNLTADFGYYVEPASLGNYIWVDSDGNGLQDDGETGLNDVEVTLVIAYPNGVSITLTAVTTDDVSSNAGWYSFDNLLLDEDYATSGGTGNPTYTISVDTAQPALSSYSPTAVDVDANGSDGEDSDNHSGVTAQAIQGLTDVAARDPESTEQTIATYDFGFVLKTVEIGNQVWIEDDNDGDVTTGNTVAVSNTIVTAIAADGTVYSATTDALGFYTITVPANAVYTVTVGSPTGMVSAGSSPIASDNDPNTEDGMNHLNTGTVVTVAEVDNLTIDFGFTLKTVEIGNLVVIEDDSDGNAATGSTRPVSNTLVTATAADGMTYTAITDDAGVYTITVPANMTYTVTVGTPSGTVVSGTPLATDNDPDGNNGMSHQPTGTVVEVGTVDNLTIDFVFRQPLRVGGMLWFDANNNEMADSVDGHAATGGVQVNLYTIDGTLVATATTDTSGEYLFEGLTAGDYQLRIPDTAGNMTLLDGFSSSTGADNIDGQVSPDNNVDNDDNGYADSGDFLFSSLPISLKAGNESSAETDGINNGNDETEANAHFPTTADYLDANSNLTVDFGFILLDLGDLPDVYGTLVTNTGATHLVWDSNKDGTPDLSGAVWLGETVDNESDGAPGAAAAGDGGDDGVSLPPTSLGAGDSFPLTVTVKMTDAASADVGVWIDYDNDGVFDNFILLDNVAAGSHGVSGLTLPEAYTDAPVYIRVRVFDAAENPTTADATGFAVNGEVEDYLWSADTYSIGNLVWIDGEEDGGGSPAPNGIYNMNTDTLVSDLTVTLFRVTDGIPEETPFMTTTTVSGAYQFTGLPAGDYQVVIPASEFGQNGSLYNVADSVAYIASPNSGSGNADDGSDHNATSTTGMVMSNVVTLGGSEPLGEAAHGLVATGEDSTTDWTIDFAFYLPESTAVGLVSGAIRNNSVMLGVVAAVALFTLSGIVRLRHHRANSEM